MSALHLIGLLVALALAVYLVWALFQARGLLMTANLVLQCAIYVVVLLALAKPLGEFMARVLRASAIPHARARLARAAHLQARA